MVSFEQWKAGRKQSVIGPQGDLSLVMMVEINEEKSVPNIPGVWAPLSKNGPGLTLTVAANQGIRVNGQVLNGTVQLIADETVVELSEGMTAMATSQPGSLHLLAIWDENCHALKAFKEITTYPFNPNWVIKGKFIPKEQTTFEFAHTADSNHTRRHDSPGEIVFTYEDTEYRVRPFLSGDHLIIVFRDQTSGKETYGMGRMLLVHPTSNGSVELDFNRSFLPPCAFSPYFNCPMPPKENRFSFPIEAGEMALVLGDK